MKKAFLGDNIYAEFDGYHVILTQETSYAKNRIALDPGVFKQLKDYIDYLYKRDDESGSVNE